MINATTSRYPELSDSLNDIVHALETAADAYQNHARRACDTQSIHQVYVAVGRARALQRAIRQIHTCGELVG